MRDDLEDLLTEHYRRAAEDIEPDTVLIDRCRGAARPAWAFPVRWGPLAAAAAVTLAVLAGWLLWPDRSSAPVAPPIAPARSAPPATPTGEATPRATPRPTPTRTVPPSMREPSNRTPSARPTGPSANPSPPSSARPPVPSASSH